MDQVKITYIASFLLSLFYGILFAIILLPLKIRLEAKTVLKNES